MSTFDIATVLRDHSNREFWRSRECNLLCWLIVELNRRNIYLPANHISAFLSPAEVVAAIGNMRFGGGGEDDETREKPCFLEVFDIYAGVRLESFKIDYAENPAVSACCVAASQDLLRCAALFNLFDDLDDFGGRITLRIFDVNSHQSIGSVDIGRGDDPDFPTCALTFGPASSEKLACIGGGYLRLFNSCSNGVFLAWQLELAPPGSNSSARGTCLAFLTDEEHLAYATLDGSNIHLAAVNLNSMCVIWKICLQSPSGAFTHVTALACAPRSNLLTVATVSRRSSVRIFAPTEVYQFKANSESLESVQNNLSAHLYAVLRLQGNQVLSMSRTSTQLIFGTMYGLFYIVNEASKRIFCYAAVDVFAHMTIEYEHLWRTHIFGQHIWRSHIDLFPHLPLTIDDQSFSPRFPISGFQIEELITWP